MGSRQSPNAARRPARVVVRPRRLYDTPGLADSQVRHGLRLIGGTLLDYRRELVLSIAGAILWMALVVVGPYLEKVVIDEAVGPGARDVLPPLVTLVVVAGLIKAVGTGGRRFFGFVLAYRVETDLRNRLFEHMQRMAFAFHDDVAAGELMSRASTDLSRVRLVLTMLPITVANVAMVLIVAGILVVLDPLLGVVAGLTIPVLLLLAWRYATRVIALSFEAQQTLADLTSVVEEHLSGIRVVKAFGQEKAAGAAVEVAADRIFDRTMAMLRIRSANVPVFGLLPSIGTLAVLWLGGYLVIEGRITLGDFLAFNQYLLVLVFPLGMTAWFLAELPRASAAAARVLEVLQSDPEIVDPAEPDPLPPGGGEVRFRDVRFSYPGGPPVLDGLDLHIPAGESLAVVGTTGSGKSTLAYLIPRFYDVAGGQVLIDGVDVRHVRLDELRREVAVAFEESFLFSTTVRENIAFGAPDATDDAVRTAARLAQADRFIDALPEGYETVVGERGYSLSGGQRQRIALARAVLRDPRVLILDDATSSVDAATELEIRAALRTVMAGRTTLIVAHRTSTLMLADRVAIIDDGMVEAIGTHRELLATSARYADVLALTGAEGSILA